MFLFIDTDGSPSGYVTWYNPFTRSKIIRTIRPVIKNERYGVQRMEMLAIYFAIADNFIHLKKILRKRVEKKRIIIGIRSDSESTIGQLRGIYKIRDFLILRIYNRINRLLEGISFKIIFKYIGRTNNMAGILLDRVTRKKVVL